MRKLRAARRLRANPPQYTHGVSRARKASAQEASRNAGMSEECAAVLARIRSAQDGGAGHCGTYASALLEFQAGAKTGHYIWWIWPSLRGVRSTSRPEYELPSFACARAYLQDATLRGRLLEITAAAVAHLEAGVPREVLFGAMHRYDAPKFVEAMTLFSAAAACEGLAGPFSALVAGCAQREARRTAPRLPSLACRPRPRARWKRTRFAMTPRGRRRGCTCAWRAGGGRWRPRWRSSERAATGWRSSPRRRARPLRCCLFVARRGTTRPAGASTGLSPGSRRFRAAPSPAPRGEEARRRVVLLFVYPPQRLPLFTQR